MKIVAIKPRCSPPWPARECWSRKEHCDLRASHFLTSEGKSDKFACSYQVSLIVITNKE